MTSDLLLEVKNLQVHLHLDEGIIKAVDGASFAVRRQRTLGIVGESGCGKSLTALSIMRLLPPKARIVGGEILFHDRRDGAERTIDLVQEDEESATMRSLRGDQLGMIFQEPMSALSPVHTIGNQMIEGIQLHQPISYQAARQQAIEILGRVGIPRPDHRIDEYPHQLSGGLRQRAMIAIALACNPVLLIADEPTTALDVTIQAQILRLLKELQQDFGMSVIIITHDLGVIAKMADDVAVMYRGMVVERADVDTIFHNPQHPYTRALLQSIPRLERPRSRRLASIAGSVPEPFAILPGCPFYPRCEQAEDGLCNVGTPPQLEETEPDHLVACAVAAREGSTTHA